MWDLKGQLRSGPGSILMMTVMILRKLRDYLKSQLPALKWGWKHFWLRKAVCSTCPLTAMPWACGQTATLQPDPDTPLPSPASPSSWRVSRRERGLLLFFTLTAAGAQIPKLLAWISCLALNQTFYWLRRSTTSTVTFLPRCHTRGDSFFIGDGSS